MVTVNENNSLTTLALYIMCIFLFTCLNEVKADGYLPMATNIYIVNTIDDNDDGQCNATHCSFREAVILSNTDGMLSEIHFDIAGTAPHVILPGSSMTPFPEISEEIIIDATTQTNWALGDIVLDGSNANSNQAINANSATNANRIELYGLTITNFDAGVYAASGSIIGTATKGNKFIDNLSYHDMALTTVAVPEPSSLALLGLASLGLIRRRRS